MKKKELENISPPQEDSLTKAINKLVGNTTNPRIKMLKELKDEFKIIFIDKVKEDPNYNLLNEEQKKKCMMLQNALLEIFDIKIKIEKINLLKQGVKQ